MKKSQSNLTLLEMNGEELKKLFLELGYSEKEYVKIVNTYPIKNMKPETLIRRVKDN